MKEFKNLKIFEFCGPLSGKALGKVESLRQLVNGVPNCTSDTP